MARRGFVRAEAPAAVFSIPRPLIIGIPYRTAKVFARPLVLRDAPLRLLNVPLYMSYS